MQIFNHIPYAAKIPTIIPGVIPGIIPAGY